MSLLLLVDLLPVTVKQLVDVKHPVGVHVFDGVQVHLFVLSSRILSFILVARLSLM